MTRLGAGGIRRLLGLLGLLAVVSTLRPPLSSVGPVLADIGRDLQISAIEVSLLSTLPLLCFAVAAPLGPWLVNHVGLHRAVTVLLVVLAVALAGRPWGGYPLLVLGTVVAAVAIAVGNVLVPVVIHADYRAAAVRMTGLYSVTLATSTAVGAGVTVPIAGLLGDWRWALASWSLVALLAALAWLPRPSNPPPGRPAHHPRARVIRDRTAWFVAGYFGLQSINFYGILTWLPTILQEAGLTAARAGLLLSMTVVVAAIAAMVVPYLSARSRSPIAAIAVTASLIAAGLVGLAIAPAATPLLWAALIGAGQGGTLPLALSLIVLRASDNDVVPSLSALTNTLGYALAASGPFVAAGLRELSGGWGVPLLFLLGTSAGQLAVGVRATRGCPVGAEQVPNIAGRPS